MVAPSPSPSPSPKPVPVIGVPSSVPPSLIPLLLKKLAVVAVGDVKEDEEEEEGAEEGEEGKGKESCLVFKRGLWLLGVKPVSEFLE